MGRRRGAGDAARGDQRLRQSAPRVSPAYRPGRFPGVMSRPAQAQNPARLDPEQRNAALARMREETFDVVVIGGGVNGNGARARRRQPRPVGRAARAARLRRRHLEPLEQADPRRAALPRADRVRAGARGAARAQPAAQRGSRRTSCGPCRSSSRCEQPRRRARVRRRRDAALRPARRRRGPAAAPPPARARRSGLARRSRPTRSSAASSTTTRRSTTPATRSPSRAPPRCTGPLVATSVRVHRASARGRARDGRARRATSTGEEIEIRRAQVINATGVWTDDVQDLVGGAARSTCAPRRASTSSCRATASSSTPG